MKLTMRVKTLLALLVVAIIWAVWQVGDDSSKSTSAPPPPRAVAAAGMGAAPVPQTIDTASIARQPWGESPFHTQTATPTSPAKAATWSLDGVIYSPTSPSAIVNRQAVSVGDTVAGAVVEAISRHSVDLKYRGKTIHLELSRGRP